MAMHSSLLRSMLDKGVPSDTREGSGRLSHDVIFSNTSPFELLIELMTQEPTVLNCLRVVQSTCLAQGIQCKIQGKKCSEDFQEFIMHHYLPFCEHAIRCLFTCGFVPWRLRRLEFGDVIPEVLPLGTFTWSIISNTSEQRRKMYRPSPGQGAASDPQKPVGDAARSPCSASQHVTKAGERGTPANDGDAYGVKRARLNPPAALHVRQQAILRRQAPVLDDSDSKLLRYAIYLTENMGISESDVEVYEYFQPSNTAGCRKSAHSSISSPMSHCITDYCILRQVQEKKVHADNWNSQAKFVCSYSVHGDRYSLHEGNPITNDWVQPQNRLGLATDTNLPVEFEQNAYTRDAVTEALVGSKLGQHTPVVYTLPKNTSLENVPRLEVTDDVGFLQQRLAKSVSSVMGIPYEIISGGYSSSTSSDRSLQNHRVFTTNMLDICRHLQILLQQVYVAIYGGNATDVRFYLFPSPRICIESVADIAMLMEMGLVSTQNAYEIANMLLGMDLKQATGHEADAGMFAKHFVTPANRQAVLQRKTEK